VGARDRALLQVLMKSQLRIAEALALVLGDYNAIESTIMVRRGKGGRQRLAVLHPSAQEAIDEWLLVKRQRGLGDPLFCSLRGKPLCRQNVRRMMKSLAARAGIRKRVHPHGFRHSGARMLAAAGVPINLISSQLGHASLSTTHHYLQVLCPVERIKRISVVNWG
jgi:site-specific recombinase XerD